MNSIVNIGDIDIDVADRDQLLQHLNCIRASKISDNEITLHNTGIYLQDIPRDPILNCSSIDYKDAEQLGYYKIDILNLGLYKKTKSREHIVELKNKDIDWSVFENKEFVEQLYHLHNHADIVVQLAPKSIEELAAVLAIIRPAKRYLKNCSWDEIKQKVWLKEKNNDQYGFKKSHAISYAMLVYVQAQLIIEEKSNECT